MGILFKNGIIVTASETIRADLLVEGEKIVQIGVDLLEQGHDVVDVSNKYLLPGGVDVHTHLALPTSGTISSDDFESGHIAAAFGGTTTHIDFASPEFGGTLEAALATWHAKADGKAMIDYGFHMTIREWNPALRAEIPMLVREGVTTLKVFTAYKGVLQMDDRDIFRAMTTAAEHGMLTMVHAENGDVIAELIARHLAKGNTSPYYHALSRPAILEGEATNRAIVMAGAANAPLYVVHMTCRDSLEALHRGREQGYPVMGETCAQYLFLTAQDHLRRSDAAKYVCSPPIRTLRDQDDLWCALRDGLLQVVSTDHCPFWYEGGANGRPPGKELGADDFSKIPNGLPVIEERLKVVWNAGVTGERIDMRRFVALNCTNPARIFGLYPQKGTLQVGSDADIVVWDADKSSVISARTHHMRTDYSIFEGMEITGGVQRVYRRGELLVEGDTWHGKPGSGRFIRRQPYAEVM